MIRKTLILVLIFFLRITVGQVNPKAYSSVYYQEVVFETDDYKMFLVKCESNLYKLKIKMRVFNKTGDIILVKPEEIAFMIKEKKLSGWAKPMIIQPNEDEVRTLDIFDPGSDMRLESFEVKLNGFYKVPFNEGILNLPSPEVPSKEANEIAVEKFTCTLLEYGLANEKTFFKYQCNYNGDKIGIIDLSKTTFQLATGKEIKPLIKKHVALVFENGTLHNFALEFRNIPPDENPGSGAKLKWNEAFHISSPVALKVISVPMKMDVDKSEK